MTAAEYARRKAAGSCAVAYCPRPATSGILCGPCRVKQRAAQRRLAREERAEKKRKGLCRGQGRCWEPATDGAMCHPCRLKTRVRQAAYKRQQYMKHKLEGVCVACQRAPCRDDSVLCRPCSVAQATRAAEARAAAPKMLVRHWRALQRARRQKRIDAGICTHCPSRDLVTETLCEMCRRYFLRNPGLSPPPPRRSAIPAPGLDAYATARNYVEVG